MSSAEARSFRGTLITSFITAFRPDIMLVEHFPLGINDELETILGNTACPKVFSTGGLLTVHDRERANIFNSRGVTAIGNLYKKIIVTADSKIVAIGSEYNLPAEVQTMVESVGYVSRQMASHAVARMRHDRRLPSGAQWVVCSAGGGALGEEFMLDCVELAHETKHVFFDIVFGPTSSLSANAPCKEVREEGRVILHRSVEGLAELHGSADVVICTGGANSLIEAMEGGAWIISCPVQTKFDDEQFVHARRLAQYYPIQLVADRSDLPRVFDGTIADVRSVGRGAPVRESNMLSFEGATRAAEIIRTLVPQ
jgi:predicted glycosyltransferase